MRLLFLSRSSWVKRKIPNFPYQFPSMKCTDYVVHYFLEDRIRTYPK
jgi:hypothetical protein